MKKILALVLALTLTLALFSCGGAIAEPTAETEPAPQTAVTEEPETTKEEKIVIPAPKISDRLTRAEIDAVPIARPDMTEQQLRQICVDYMVLQQGVVWTPDQNWTYEISYAAGADNLGNINLLAGQRYSGLPYTSAAMNLESFMDYYDEETGILAISKAGAGAAAFIGDTCSTSCYWGWARISSTVTLRGVRWVNSAYHFTPLGSYTYTLTSDNELVDTDKVCAANGEKTMYEAYALLTTASGLMTYVNSPGHVRMVMEPAHVERLADGSIDGEKSYVIVVEQSSSNKDYTNEDGKVHAIGKVANKSTFKKLYGGGYLPFEIEELSGKATVQTAEVRLKNGAETLDALLQDDISSNYAIARVRAVFKNAAGETAYETRTYGNCYTAAKGNVSPYEMKISKVFASANLRRNLTDGEVYSLTLEVTIGNGETKTIEFPAFTYQK